MLQRLREKAQGWFAWLILGAIAVTFVLFGTANFFTSSGPDESLVKVNGSSISEWEVERAYQRIITSPGNEGLRQADPTQVKKEVLEGLIEERILLQNAKKLGLSVSDERVNTIILGLPFVRNANGEFSQEAYLQFLAQANFTDHSFRQFIRDNLISQQMQQAIIGTAFALPMDVKDYVQYLNQRRDFRYTVLGKQNLNQTVAVTDENVKQYYDGHLNQFVTPEKISLDYIHLSLDDIVKNLKYTDQDLEVFYRDNLNAFTVPESAHVEHILIATPKGDSAAEGLAKEKIAKIQDALKKGVSFESLAREYSDDKASAERGGELSWFVAGEMVPEFEKAAFALSANQTSEPVKTEFGYHIIKLLDKKPQQVKPFYEVREEATEKYKQTLAQEQLAEQSEELAQLAFDAPDSLQGAADKLGKSIEKTELFSEGKLQNALLNRPEVMSVAFSSSVKDDKNNSDLIKLDDNDYVVIRVADWVAPKQMSLDEVKSGIQTMLIEQQVEGLLKSESNQIIKSVTENPKSEENYVWDSKEGVLRSDTNLEPNIVEAAFSMPRTLNSSKPELKAVKLNNGDYAIVWLTNVVNGTTEGMSESQMKAMQSELQGHWGRLEFALYVNSLINKANIKRK